MASARRGRRTGSPQASCTVLRMILRFDPVFFRDLSPAPRARVSANAFFYRVAFVDYVRIILALYRRSLEFCGIFLTLGRARCGSSAEAPLSKSRDLRPRKVSTAHKIHPEARSAAHRDKQVSIRVHPSYFDRATPPERSCMFLHSPLTSGIR